MKFFKLGLIFSVVVLNGATAFAGRGQRPPTHMRAIPDEKAWMITHYDATEEFETLGDEAAKDFGIKGVGISNTYVNGGFGEIFNRLLSHASASLVGRSIKIDQDKFEDALPGAKRWAIYYLTAQLIMYKSSTNNLAEEVRKAFYSDDEDSQNRQKKYEAELEREAGKTACDMVQCEKCCIEFADFIEPLYERSVYPARHQSPQEIRELAKQHAGKTCKYHTKQLSTQDSINEAMENVESESIRDLINEVKNANCQECFLEFANFIKHLSPMLPQLTPYFPKLKGSFPTPQKIRAFAKQYTGKACSDHTKQPSTQDSINEAASNVDNQSVRDFINEVQNANCQECCLETAHFIKYLCRLFPERSTSFPTHQRIRELAKQHAGKACSDHAKQVTTETTVQA